MRTIPPEPNAVLPTVLTLGGMGKAQQAKKGPKGKAPEDPAFNEAISKLRGKLANEHQKIVNIFQLWDKDGSGTVAKKEVRERVPSKLACP